jgi:hypothetical protein
MMKIMNKKVPNSEKSILKVESRVEKHKKLKSCEKVWNNMKKCCKRLESLHNVEKGMLKREKVDKVC